MPGPILKKAISSAGCRPASSFLSASDRSAAFAASDAGGAAWTGPAAGPVAAASFGGSDGLAPHERRWAARIVAANRRFGRFTLWFLLSRDLIYSPRDEVSTHAPHSGRRRRTGHRRVDIVRPAP